jgi:photosystem II stability/assembly factor-like uncharacterized protein
VYQKNDSTASLWGVAFADSNTAVAAGDAATILRTTNGGAAWRAIPVNPYFGLRRVSFADSLDGTAVGFDYYEQSALILRTTDAGLTWTRQIGGVNTELWDESFPTRNFGMIVGLNGTILRTTDGGAIWTQQPGGAGEDLIAVAMRDTLTGTIVGADGTILRSTDGGATWVLHPRVAGAPLYGVAYGDAQSEIAVGSGGTILRSTDGGNSWAARSVGLSNILLDVVSQTGGIFTVVGWNTRTGKGIILRTTDGGGDWDSTGVDYYLSAVGGSPDGALLSAGTGGTIIREVSSCAPFPNISVARPADGALHEPDLTISGFATGFNFGWSFVPAIFASGSIIQVAKDSAFGNMVIDSSLLLNGSRINTGLVSRLIVPGSRYYWHVRIRNADGSASDWSKTWTFTAASGGIGGIVFEDKNRDTVPDGMEKPLVGWKTLLSGSVQEVSFTDSAGRFSFGGLDSGSYAVSINAPTQWVVTWPATGLHDVFLGVNGVDSAVNFGVNIGYDTVSGRVFDDRNENGLLDNGEPGVAGWKIMLEGLAVDSAETDSSGYFAFPALSLGSYTISVVAASSWEQIYPQLEGGISFSLNKYGESLGGQNFAVHPIPPRVKMVIEVEDRSRVGFRNVWFGVRPGAAFGIWGIDSAASNVDFSEGEFELPPQLPGVFDARFVSPVPSGVRFGYGSWTDMRAYIAPAQADTYRLAFQPGTNYGGDYPMKIRWSSGLMSSSYDGIVVLFDSAGDLVSMRNSDSVVIADSSVTSVTIIARSPHIPLLGVRPTMNAVPVEFSLLQNFPNPFNPSTTIRYGLPHTARVVLALYNILGEKTAVLADGVQSAGYESVVFNAAAYPSGMYFYRLEASDVENPSNSFTMVKKLVVLR